MIGRLSRWVGGIILAAVLVAAVTAAWLVATESGARWLLAQASPYLPDPLTIEAVDGTLLEGLEFRQVDWQDGAATVSIATLAARAELPPLLKREVRINSLTIMNVDVALAPRAEQDTDPQPFSVDVPLTLRIDNALIENVHIATEGSRFAIDSIRLGGELSGTSLSIRRFDLQSELADIGLSGEAQLSGKFRLSGSAGWALRLQDQPPLEGVLSIRGDATRYELEHSLDAPYEITTRGFIAIVDAGISMDVNNQWQRIRIQQGDAPPVELTDGQLRILGVSSEFEFSAVTALSSTDVPVADVQMRGRYQGDTLDFESLSAVNDWGRLDAGGKLQLSAEASWSFDLALHDLNPSVVDPRLEGNLGILANTSGRLVDGQPDLDLRIDEISGNLNGYPVNGGVTVSYADERLQFDDAVVRVGDNRIDFSGLYGPRLSVVAKARLSNLSQFGLGIEGTLHSDFSVESDLDTFAAFGSIDGENLAWGAYAVERLDARFDLPATGEATATLQMDSTEQGSLSASFDGRFVNDRWLGALNSLAVRREPVGEWMLQSPASFSLSPSSIELQNACLGAASADGLICIALNYDFAGALKFETSVQALPVAALPRYLPEGASVLGKINANASGDFTEGLLNASSRLQIDGLGLVTSFEGDEVSAKFEVASANAEVVDNRLAGEFEFRLAGSTDHASGTIGIENLFNAQSALSGKAALALQDLALLSFFVPDIGNPLGNIYGNVELSGNLSAPEISGEVGLREGSANIRRAGISVSEIGLLVRQSKAGELSLQGSAKSGDGYLQISGLTAFSAESGVRSEVRLNGEDFALIRLPDLQVTASPAIGVLFDERATRVTGELGIPQASITIKTVPETTEKPSPDAVIHRGEVSVQQSRRALFVDVTTRLGDDVSFAGFGLSTRLEGSVRISGDSKSPFRGFGRVVLREGRYRAYGQNLEIETGELIFNGPITNPALNVRATRTASDKTVAGILLTGTPAQLKSQVYSEPPLSDAEALSYLLTGRPLSNANSAEGDMLNQAAFALGLTTAGNVASRIRNELGLETLGIQGGSENRQLVAGKRIGDRLFVEYAYGVVDSLGTLLLRYQLTRRLVVESRSGSVRNVDVVYTVKRP